MVTKLRNYSTTAEATMTKFKLSSKAIYLGGNPKKMNFLAVQVTEIFDLNGKLRNGLNSYFFHYISTDEVEKYCYRSRNPYFMVTKLRNYSTTAEATMTKFKLSSKAIYPGGNPKIWTF